jgi:hypothetical protein
METSFAPVLYFFISLSAVVLAIALMWYLLWKFILEPNPVVRDFFDLDLKDASVDGKNKKS